MAIRIFVSSVKTVCFLSSSDSTGTCGSRKRELSIDKPSSQKGEVLVKGRQQSDVQASTL